jgi:protein-tyrosine phosphatase
LSQWIDIHNHLLPAVDDGAVSLDQTRRMLQIAYEEGIHLIIATPHYGAGCCNMDKEILLRKLELVQKEAGLIDPGFEIELGNEVFYSEDITEHLRQKKAMTLAGTRYVLVEFAKADDYQTIRTGIHRLLMYGYLPVLAHVERYHCLYENYEGIYELIRLGAYMQMNISSIIPGKHGSGFCRRLLEYDLIQLMGTDSHSDFIRAPKIKDGIRIIRKKFGVEVLNRLMFENPVKLLKNQYI